MAARAAEEPNAGFFAPTSVTWRVNREAALLLGGARALLLQLAHPLVAAGVDEWSDFRSDPLGRLRRTLALSYGMVFGDRAEALACAARINRAHERVHGVLKDATRPFPAGTPYDARDPALLLWVQATLIDSALATYACFVAPLGRAERARYYEEAKRLSPFFGIPASHVPADYPAFRAYWRAMLEGPELEVTPTARRLADAVLHPPLRGVPRALGDATSVITLGLLPPAIRRRYRLPWRGRERIGWRAARALLRTSGPWLPARLRLAPPARAAEQRLARAR